MRVYSLTAQSNLLYEKMYHIANKVEDAILGFTPTSSKAFKFPQIRQ